MKERPSKEEIQRAVDAICDTLVREGISPINSHIALSLISEQSKELLNRMGVKMQLDLQNIVVTYDPKVVQ